MSRYNSSHHSVKSWRAAPWPSSSLQCPASAFQELGHFYWMCVDFLFVCLFVSIIQRTLFKVCVCSFCKHKYTGHFGLIPQTLVQSTQYFGTVYTVQSTRYSPHSTLVQSTRYFGTVYSLHGTLVQSTVCTVLWYSLHGTLVQSTRYSLHGTLVQSTLGRNLGGAGAQCTWRSPDRVWQQWTGSVVWQQWTGSVVWPQWTGSVVSHHSLEKMKVKARPRKLRISVYCLSQ